MYPNVRKCFELAAKTQVKLLESTLEKALIRLSQDTIMQERDFVNLFIQCKTSLTTRVLNDLIEKLLEANKKNVVISLFNLAVNGAFPNVKDEEVNLSLELMKLLLVLQQKKM